MTAAPIISYWVVFDLVESNGRKIGGGFMVDAASEGEAKRLGRSDIRNRYRDATAVRITSTEPAPEKYQHPLTGQTNPDTKA